MASRSLARHSPNSSKFISVRGGFEPHVAYGLVYEAKDPKVQGIGFAATRDLISFLRYAQDASNPLAGTIHKAIAFRVSQAGNFLKISTTRLVNSKQEP
jgi:hypothetical protein